MRILVIGRSGQLAQALAERAPHHPGCPAVRLLGRPDVDLSDASSLRRALSGGAADLVINAAAYTAVDAAEHDERAAHALNAVGPGALAEASAAHDIPLIHVSTDYVFNGNKAEPYTENDAIDPQTAYGRTKAAGEAAVRAVGHRAIVARTAWVFSPFGKNFVKTMLRLGQTKPELNIVGDQFGNPTSALDLADALLALAAQRERWGDQPDVVHCVGTGDASWHDLAVATFEAAGMTPTVHAIAAEAFPTPAKRPANSRLDTAKLADRYQITLPDWRESLPAIVARIRAHGAESH